MKAWGAVGTGLVLFVVCLSLTPDPFDAGTVEEVKVGHFFAYAVLMLWFSQLLRPRWARLAAGLALVAMGIGLEFAQALTPHRTFAYADMCDNAIGVAVGFALALTPLGGALAELERRFARS